MPDGFLLRNRPDRVQAIRSDGAAIVFDMDRLAGGSLAAYLQRRWAKGVPLREIERIEVNGLPAITATARGRGQQGIVDYRFLAMAGAGGRLYRFIYVTPARETARLSEALRRSTYSFRTLTAEQAARINALRLLVIRTGAGDSIAGLARTLPFGRFNDDWFRVLNDLQPGQPLPAGTLAKVVAS